ncbi:MAG: gamma-glutamyltransferase, partial [Myxococcales bacterium]|nr:gamma-glutamyltransferase [Myxococcales bacterium]
MAGVVAAGSIATAEVAASILRMGGTAVDAAVAGALACFAAEPLLASAGGAGIMVVRRPGEQPLAIDFFSTVPGSSGRPERLDFHAVEVNFGAARQAFHVGRAAAAVPLVLDGLALAALQFGLLPLKDLVAPAARLAREGVVADALTARTFELLWQILARDPECMAEIAEGLPGDRPPRAGEVLRNPKLAETLERFAANGATPPELRDGLLTHFGPERGGLICAADLANAKVEITAPHTFALGDWMVSTSPRLGGRLVGLIAGALCDVEPEADEAAEVLRQAQASLSGHRARLLLPPANHRGATTHVSVVDDLGGAASVTLT